MSQELLKNQKERKKILGLNPNIFFPSYFPIFPLYIVRKEIPIYFTYTSVLELKFQDIVYNSIGATRNYIRESEASTLRR